MGHIISQGPNGAATIWHDDPDTGDVVVENRFDAAPAIDSAAVLRNEVTQTGDLIHAMRVPIELVWKWKAEGKLGEQAFYENGLCIDMETLGRLMRDPDIAKFRCVDKI